MPPESSWKTELLAMLHDRWATREVFSLSDAYGFAETLTSLHPENKHVEDKVRQVLQDLRDDGEVKFEDDRGHYSLLKPTLVPDDPISRESDSELRGTLLTIRDLDDQVVTSERLQGLIKGFGGHKGIYKPGGSERALWVRQTSRGVYPDKDVVPQSDGSWVYLYSPEGREGKIDLSLDTNKGLLKCMTDRVPIGVFRQAESESGKTRYRVLGLAYVEKLEGDHFVLRGEGNDVTLPPLENVETTFSPYELSSHRLGHVARVLRDRRFGISVRRLYNHRCSLCNVGYMLSGRSIGLEAAHMIPVESGGNLGDSRNGILLCRNHHALFDQYAWTIDREFKVRVADDGELRESAVANHILQREGKILPNLPQNRVSYPATEAIDWRLDAFESAWK
ncbi:MAG: HNH endonuclease [Thermoplasmata archaeon]|nr:HNH endonuclease [Thermoplasmata archaeon]